MWPQSVCSSSTYLHTCFLQVSLLTLLTSLVILAEFTHVCKIIWWQDKAALRLWKCIAGPQPMVLSLLSLHGRVRQEMAGRGGVRGAVS